MQVEVCVQDSLDELESGNSPATIAPETWEGWFLKWLTVLQPELSAVQAYELSLRLTDDREIQGLNAQYRQQDKPTDVLAFAALEVEAPLLDELGGAEQPLYLGDIVISLDTAQRQAEAQGHALATELAWLAAHGLLHLLGWDHPDDDSLLKMLNQQQKLLNTVGLSIQDGLYSS
ncbi:MAG TPA: rRNA maturation RNase YbeY [Microcoleaceae cyanobacterium]|jgi:probable rRNA maturation factor